MKKKLVVLLGLGFGFTPLFASAVAYCGNLPSGDIEYLICRASQILNAVIPFLVALGVIYFIWGVVQYVMASEEEAKKKGKERMIWGIIGLVVIVSMWGIVGIITNSFDLSGTTVYDLPCVEGPGVQCP